MKKIFTLILALGSMTAIFAQSGHRGWSGNGSDSYQGNSNYSSGYNHQYNGGATANSDHGYYQDRGTGYDRREGRDLGSNDRYEGRSFEERSYRERPYGRDAWFHMWHGRRDRRYRMQERY